MTTRVLNCQVWQADIGQETPAHRQLLDATERARREALSRPADRARFTVAAALLRLAVSGHTGVAPQRVRVDRRCTGCGAPHGKPTVADTGLHVSVAHSGATVLVAVTQAAPVGVDAEAIVACDTAGLARLVLAGGERITQPRDFFTYWCRKESVVKATGEGLRAALSQVRVSGPAEPARLLSYRGAARAASMCDLAVGPGYAAALTVLDDGMLRVDRCDGAALLSI